MYVLSIITSIANLGKLLGVRTPAGSLAGGAYT
jgi:hypothetical protein